MSLRLGAVNPSSGLTLDNTRNFYGTTELCVDTRCFGTVFEITP